MVCSIAIFWIFNKIINFFVGIIRLITGRNMQQIATFFILIIIFFIGAKFQHEIPMLINLIIVIAPFAYVCHVGSDRN